MPDLILEQSIWYVPLCLLLAAGISYLVYSKKTPWNGLTNRLLMVARFLLIFFLMILLLNPLLNQIINNIEQPVMVLALDNSLSMEHGLDSAERRSLLNEVKKLEEKLISKNYDVFIHTLESKVSDISEVKFNQKTTNIDLWLRDLQSTYEGRNLGGVYLISDGKYNQGTSPAFFPYGFKVMAWGVGDTLQKTDVALQNVLYNKIAYQGNKFPVVAEVVNHGYKDVRTQVEISSKGKVLTSKALTFNNLEGLTRVELELEAEQNGMQQLDVKVVVLKGESTVSNNTKRIFIDVVDGKQKILMVAPAPHPDLKALAAVIEKNQNYELITYIPGIQNFQTEKYDLVISHQAYSRYKRANEVVQEQRNQGVPVLMIFGNRSNILMASRTESHFTFSQRGAKRDKVFGALNPDFSLFSWDDSAPMNFTNYPPVSVPYGGAKLPAQAEVLLYQRVGSIQTDRPLLYFTEENNSKSAFMLAEGFWRWRMQEYAIADGTSAFDQIFLKTIQYLSTKVDKRKFKFYPTANSYFENQPVRFHGEIYNQIYERVFGQSIQVKITGDGNFLREYNFTPSSAYSRLEASNFPPGLYSYEAKTTLNDKQETVYGKFSIKELQLEALDQVADFDLLRQVAFNTEGRFYIESDEMLKDADSFQLKGVIHSQEDIFPVIHLRWLLFILLALVTLEWFTRKYNGGY